MNKKIFLLFLFMSVFNLYNLKALELVKIQGLIDQINQNLGDKNSKIRDLTKRIQDLEATEATVKKTMTEVKEKGSVEQQSELNSVRALYNEAQLQNQAFKKQLEKLTQDLEKERAINKDNEGMAELVDRIKQREEAFRKSVDERSANEALQNEQLLLDYTERGKEIDALKQKLENLNKETIVILDKIDAYEKEKQELLAQNQDLIEKVDSNNFNQNWLTADVTRLKKDLEQEQKQHKEYIDILNNRHQENINDLNKENNIKIKNLEAELTKLQKQNAELTDSRNQKYDELHKKFIDLSFEIANLKDALKTAQKEKDQLNATIKGLTAELEFKTGNQAYIKELETENQKFKSFAEENKKLKAQIQILQGDIEVNKQELDVNKDEIEFEKENVKNLEKEKQELLRQNENLRQNLNALQKEKQNIIKDMELKQIQEEIKREKEEEARSLAQLAEQKKQKELAEQQAREEENRKKLEQQAQEKEVLEIALEQKRLEAIRNKQIQEEEDRIRKEAEYKEAQRLAEEQRRLQEQQELENSPAEKQRKLNELLNQAINNLKIYKQNKDYLENNNKMRDLNLEIAKERQYKLDLEREIRKILGNNKFEINIKNKRFFIQKIDPENIEIIRKRRNANDITCMEFLDKNKNLLGTLFDLLDS